MKLSFSIEKPIRITEESDLAKDSVNYVSQLKIDEHRSFLILENGRLTVLGWRGNVHHVMQGVLCSQPYNRLVFDGGIIRTLEFKKRPLLYVFDILMIDDNRVTQTYQERYDLLNDYRCSPFIIPECHNDHIKQYNDLKSKKSSAIDRFAERAGLATQRAYELCEGLVLKKLDGKLKYPANMTHNANQLKLKLPGR